jgi:hypothetical protein
MAAHPTAITTKRKNYCGFASPMPMPILMPLNERNNVAFVLFVGNCNRPFITNHFILSCPPELNIPKIQYVI